MSNTPELILQLIETFDRNIDNFKKQNYNEAQVRQQFINPFFEALGWDMQNKAGIALAYSDVIHEDAIKVGGSTKAPDYCFRIGETKKFFVEAKKPSVDIKSDISPAYQLRRYAWSAKLPLSILTDFEEFAVYDCQVRPNVNDKPSTARIFFCNYKEYAEKWEEIAKIFSKEAVLKGLFDTYASQKTTKRGTTTVDKEFLAEIEGWRNELAKNIAIRNSRLSVYDLNFVVQKTIDRILFLRICEDRGIERVEQLLGLINGSRIYPRLFELFEKSDERYNSGIFHFRKEKDKPESPDELSAHLKVDDDVLKKIIKNLYYPCPYEFSIMPAEILGNVYEQFLGKVVRLTASHQAKVEEKPEVKKAGGVYYTPSYIVDYIVKNTVGKLCEGKTPKQIEKLKILDPACGSGSFLIGAYQYLLDFHRDYYAEDPAKHKKAIYQGKGGQWFLTIDEKKRILLNNIYGVDIDSQAVEVTKLSLLLKVLENETQESLRLFHERALPDLGSNIKCGNSLIGYDFYENRQLNLFDEEEKHKINAFDWQAAFPGIFKQGGFDCVIGNPPYLFITEVPTNHRAYYQSKYHGVDYRFDLYGAFIEQASANLLSKKGLLGFIIPHTLLSNDSFRELRMLLAKNTTIYKIIDIGPGVFRNANNETMLLFFETKPSGSSTKVDVICTTPKEFPIPTRRFTAVHNEWVKKTGDPWLVHASTGNMAIIRKIELYKTKLGECCSVNQGLRTGNNAKYLSEKTHGEKWKAAAGGKHVSRYSPIIRELYVFYEPAVLDAPRKPEIFFSKEKIVVQEVRNISLPRRIVATLDCSQTICLQSTNVINKKPSCSVDIRYILGVLNSTLVNFFFKYKFPGNNHIPSNQLSAIPVPADNKHMNKSIGSLVEQMLELNKKLTGIKNPDEKTRLGRQIEATDSQIDKLVYDLYSLTPEEIKIVESDGKKQSD